MAEPTTGVTGDFAKKHLDLVLTFFPRVEARISLLVGVEVAMLGVLASRMPPFVKFRQLDCITGSSVITAAALLATSLILLYLASFPNLAGGEQSFIYFREVAARTEARFTAGYKTLTEQQILDDLIGQVWRNAMILRSKFHRLKLAYILFAVATIPWLAALVGLPAKS